MKHVTISLPGTTLSRLRVEAAKEGKSMSTCLDGPSLDARYRLSFFDSTMLAAALAYGYDIFLSEGLAHSQRIGDLTILNPFTTAIEAVLIT